MRIKFPKFSTQVRHPQLGWVVVALAETKEQAHKDYLRTIELERGKLQVSSREIVGNQMWAILESYTPSAAKPKAKKLPVLKTRAQAVNRIIKLAIVDLTRYDAGDWLDDSLAQQDGEENLEAAVAAALDMINNV